MARVIALRGGIINDSGEILQRSIVVDYESFPIKSGF